MKSAASTVRVGTGAGFSDDRFEPARDLAERGAVDYLVSNASPSARSRAKLAEHIVRERLKLRGLTYPEIRIVSFRGAAAILNADRRFA